MYHELTAENLQNLREGIRKKLATYKGKVGEMHDIKREVLEKIIERLHVSPRTSEVYQQGVGRLFHYLSQLRTYDEKWQLATQGNPSKVGLVIDNLSGILGGEVQILQEMRTVFNNLSVTDDQERRAFLVRLAQDFPELAEMALMQPIMQRMLSSMIAENHEGLADVFSVIKTFRGPIRLPILFPLSVLASPFDIAMKNNPSVIMTIIDLMRPLLASVQGGDYPYHNEEELKLAALNAGAEISDPRLLAFYVRHRLLNQQASAFSPVVSELLAETHEDILALVSDILAANADADIDLKLKQGLEAVLVEYEETGDRIESTKSLQRLLADVSSCLPDSYQFLPLVIERAGKVSLVAAVADKGFIATAAINRNYAKRALVELMGNQDIPIAEKIELILQAETETDPDQKASVHQLPIFHCLSEDHIADLFQFLLRDRQLPRQVVDADFERKCVVLTETLQVALAWKSGQREVRSLKDVVSTDSYVTALKAALTVQGEVGRLLSKYVIQEQNWPIMVKRAVVVALQRHMRDFRLADILESVQAERMVLVDPFWRENILSFLAVVSSDNDFGKLARQGVISRLRDQLQKLESAVRKSLPSIEGEFTPRKRFIESELSQVSLPPNFYDTYLFATAARHYPDLVRACAESPVGAADDKYDRWFAEVTGGVACSDVEVLKIFYPFIPRPEFCLRPLAEGSAETMLSRSARLSLESYEFLLNTFVDQSDLLSDRARLTQIIASAPRDEAGIKVFYAFLDKLTMQFRTRFLLFSQADEVMLIEQRFIYIEAPFSYFIDCLRALSSERDVRVINRVSRAWAAKKSYYRALYNQMLARATFDEDSTPPADPTPRENIHDALVIARQLVLLSKVIAGGLSERDAAVAESLKKLMRLILADQYVLTYINYPEERRGLGPGVYKSKLDGLHWNVISLSVENFFARRRLAPESALLPFCVELDRNVSAKGVLNEFLAPYFWKSISRRGSDDQRGFLLEKNADGYQLIQSPHLQKIFASFSDRLDSDVFWDLIHDGFTANEDGKMDWLQAAVEECSSDKEGLDYLKFSFMLHFCYMKMKEVRAKYRRIIDSGKELTDRQLAKQAFIDRLIAIFAPLDEDKVGASIAKSVIKETKFLLPILIRTEMGGQSDKGLHSDVRDLLQRLNKSFGVLEFSSMPVQSRKEQLIAHMREMSVANPGYNLGVFRLLVDFDRDLLPLFLDNKAGLHAFHYAISSGVRDCTDLIAVVKLRCPQFLFRLEAESGRHALQVAVIDHPDAVEDILEALYQLPLEDQIRYLAVKTADAEEAAYLIQYKSVHEAIDPGKMLQLIAYAAGTAYREADEVFIQQVRLLLDGYSEYWWFAAEMLSVAEATVALRAVEVSAEDLSGMAAQVSGLQGIVRSVLEHAGDPGSALEEAAQAMASFSCDDIGSPVFPILSALRGALLSDRAKVGKKAHVSTALGGSVLMVPIKSAPNASSVDSAQIR